MRIGHKSNKCFASVNRNAYGEYVVRLYAIGNGHNIHFKQADYYTDDREDAIGTAQIELDRMVEKGIV